MADASTVALHLIFLGTVALGLLMFLAGLALFSIVLVAAGAGRLAAVLLSGLSRWTRSRVLPGLSRWTRSRVLPAAPRPGVAGCHLVSPTSSSRIRDFAFRDAPRYAAAFFFVTACR